MESSPAGPRTPQPRSCPSCKSSNTIRTNERFGEELFFCADCEHTWLIRAASASEKSKGR